MRRCPLFLGVRSAAVPERPFLAQGGFDLRGSSRRRTGSPADVFRDNGSAWVEEDTLIASDAAAGDLFGISVAVDGGTIVIGAVGDDDNGGSSGSAYVLRDSQGTWEEEAKFTASDGAAGDLFGSSVGVAGGIVFVGSPHDDDAGDFTGAAYVLVPEPSTLVLHATAFAALACVTCVARRRHGFL